MRVVWVGVLLLAACHRGDPGPGRGGAVRPPGSPKGGGPTTPPAQPFTSTDEPIIPNDNTPPIGVTWYVGFKENVTLAEMQQKADDLTVSSQWLWNTSRGQVFLYKVKFFDAVAGDGNINSFGGFPTTVDIWYKPWDDEPSGVGGYVIYSQNVGRIGRIVAMPPDAGQSTTLHEGSHFLFDLSWNVSPGLGDEYSDPGDAGWQTEACIMNLGWSPVRWCHTDNHVPRQEQGAQSCWQQILADYPNWTYPDAWVESDPPAEPEFEFNDTP